MEEIFINGNAEETQVEISGTILSLRTLGDILTQTTTKTTLNLQTRLDKFYPKKFESLQIIYQEDQTNRVSIQIKDSKFIIKGNSIALSILGDSLNNFFDKESKNFDHFHIDYYNENDVLNPTNISLIFMCL